MKIKDLKQRISGMPSLCQYIYIWRGSRMFLRAVSDAERRHSEDGYRYYVIYDPTVSRLISVTYELHHKEGRYLDYRRLHPYATYRDYICSARADSYKALVHRGRFKNRLSQQEFREMAFYYTSSHNGATMPSDAILSQRKKEWLHYYVSVISQRCSRIGHTKRGFSVLRLLRRISSHT